jgi:hypothetical protein
MRVTSNDVRHNLALSVSIRYVVVGDVDFAIVGWCEACESPIHVTITLTILLRDACCALLSSDLKRCSPAI